MDELRGAPGTPAPDELRQVIALDGPAGTGKTSVARGVAARLGWRFVDTGATYRAVTLAVLDAGVDPEDPERVAVVARGARVGLSTDPADPRVTLSGRDVSTLIRSDAVTGAVSAVSSVPAVRELLVAFQRRAMGTDGAVVEGRDIATVVAPGAVLKVYLDARPEVRAQRRAGDLRQATAAGDTAAAQVAVALAARDQRDSQTNALRASREAVEVDTSDLDLDAVIDTVVALASDAGAA
ncbi:MAG: (d)CMP kinase [Mycobacteriales bacterium]